MQCILELALKCIAQFSIVFHNLKPSGQFNNLIA